MPNQFELYLNEELLRTSQTTKQLIGVLQSLRDNELRTRFKGLLTITNHIMDGLNRLNNRMDAYIMSVFIQELTSVRPWLNKSLDIEQEFKDTEHSEDIEFIVHLCNKLVRHSTEIEELAHRVVLR